MTTANTKAELLSKTVEHVDIAANGFNRGQRFVGRVLERLVVVFSEKKGRHQRIQLAVKPPHQIAPAPLS